MVAGCQTRRCNMQKGFGGENVIQAGTAQFSLGFLLVVILSYIAFCGTSR